MRFKGIVPPSGEWIGPCPPGESGRVFRQDHRHSIQPAAVVGAFQNNRAVLALIVTATVVVGVSCRCCYCRCCWWTPHARQVLPFVLLSLSLTLRLASTALAMFIGCLTTPSQTLARPRKTSGTAIPQVNETNRQRSFFGHRELQSVLDSCLQLQLGGSACADREKWQKKWLSGNNKDGHVYYCLSSVLPKLCINEIFWRACASKKEGSPRDQKCATNIIANIASTLAFS